MIVAELRTDAIDALVARAGVIHRDPGGGFQPRPQHVARFAKKPVLAGDQQAHDLALGNADADRVQLFHQPFHRHLALMVLHQHEAAQFRPEMAGHPCRQRRDHGDTLRRHPTLAPVADDLRPQHQLLHHEGLVSFEPRPRRHRRLDDPLRNTRPRRQLATAAPFVSLTRSLRLARLLHAARLDAWPTFQPLQPRVLIAQLRNQPLLFRHFAKQLQHQSFELGGRQLIEVGGRGHAQVESNRPASGQAKNQPPPGLLPRLPLLATTRCKSWPFRPPPAAADGIDSGPRRRRHATDRCVVDCC